MVNQSLYTSSFQNGSTHDHSHLSSSPASNSSLGDLRCPEPAVGLLFWMTLDIVTMTVGVPSNLRVLWALLRQEIDISTSDVFVGSLAALDCAYCLLLPAHLLKRMLIEHTAFSHALRFSLGLNEVGGPLFLCCLCLDRYTAVLRPMVYLRLRSASHPRVATAALLWLFVLVYSALVAASVFLHSNRVSVGLFLAAFVVMTFCNVSILRALRRAGPNGSDTHPVKQRALRTVRGALALLLVCFLPAAAVFPYSSALPKKLFRCYIYPMCYSFVSLRAALQPLLYLLQTKKLQCQGGGAQGSNSKYPLCQGGGAQGSNGKYPLCQGGGPQGSNGKYPLCQGGGTQGSNGNYPLCQGGGPQGSNDKKPQCQGGGAQGCNSKYPLCQGGGPQGSNGKKLQCQGGGAQGCNSKYPLCQGGSPQGSNGKYPLCQGGGAQGCNGSTPLGVSTQGQWSC